jgi:tryptophan-rich sensory protein
MRSSTFFILFLAINFGGLVLGSWLMDHGPTTDWYLTLNKAPWTPPGWVFGVTWTLIMICFSGYLALAFQVLNTKRLQILFVLSLFLNVIWNYVFFNVHQIGWGLIIIILLTIIVVTIFGTVKHNRLRTTRYLLLPYMIWLCLATSLNLYILLFN